MSGFYDQPPQLLPVVEVDFEHQIVHLLPPAAAPTLTDAQLRAVIERCRDLRAEWEARGFTVSDGFDVADAA